MRDERLEVGRQFNKMKAEEAELGAAIIKQLGEARLTTGAGKLATVSVKRTKIGQIEDWPKFFAWMTQHKAVDMVQKRINNGALRDRLAENEDVPSGIRLETVVGITLTAKKAKS